VVLFAATDVAQTEKLLKAVNPNQLFLLSNGHDKYEVEAAVEIAKKIV